MIEVTVHDVMLRVPKGEKPQLGGSSRESQNSFFACRAAQGKHRK